MEKDKRSPNTTRMTHTIPTKTKRKDVLLLKSSTTSSRQPLILPRSLLLLLLLLLLLSRVFRPFFFYFWFCQLYVYPVSRLSHRQVNLVNNTTIYISIRIAFKRETLQLYNNTTKHCNANSLLYYKSLTFKHSLFKLFYPISFLQMKNNKYSYIYYITLSGLESVRVYMWICVSVCVCV